MALDADSAGGPSSVELRLVTPDEWRLWREVRLGALAEAPYAFGSRFEDWQHADETRWRQRLGLEGSHNLVALVDGTPVGMASGVSGERPGTAGLISMYVSPPARGTGLAARLIDAVVRWAARQGAHTLCLDVRADNGRARRSYERLGFEVVGEVPRNSVDEPLELRMCKPVRG